MAINRKADIQAATGLARVMHARDRVEKIRNEVEGLTVYYIGDDGDTSMFDALHELLWDLDNALTAAKHDLDNGLAHIHGPADDDDEPVFVRFSGN